MGWRWFFRNSPEASVQCAVELFRAGKQHPELQLRMGIHSGPINQVADVNERANVTGAGIKMAQRVMDCGDAGHILLSQRVADDLEQYPRWRPLLHELGECEVKHGVRLRVVNLYTEDQALAGGSGRIARADSYHCWCRSIFTQQQAINAGRAGEKHRRSSVRESEQRQGERILC